VAAVSQCLEPSMCSRAPSWGTASERGADSPHRHECPDSPCRSDRALCYRASRCWWSGRARRHLGPRDRLFGPKRSRVGCTSSGACGIWTRGDQSTSRSACPPGSADAGGWPGVDARERLRDAVVEPSEHSGRHARRHRVSGFRRQSPSGIPARDGAVSREPAARRSQRGGSAERELHLCQRAAGA